MIILNTLKVLFVLAVYYGCVYLFNHYNAWVGILSAILFTASLITYLFKPKNPK